MDGVFYFSFYNSATHGDQSFVERWVGFYITNMQQLWDDTTQHLSVVASNLREVYGEHDYYFPHAHINALGCLSYGVEEIHHDEVMEYWRQAFLKQCPGCEVSAVYEVPRTIKRTSADIFQFLKQSYEHTQAQLLRATLNQHVGGGSVAPFKKI